GMTIETPLGWAKDLKVVRLGLVSMDRARERLTLQAAESIEEETSFTLYSIRGKKVAHLKVLTGGKRIKAKVTKLHRPELLKRGGRYKTRLKSAQLGSQERGSRDEADEGKPEKQ